MISLVESGSFAFYGIFNREITVFPCWNGDSGDYTEEYYVVTNADKLKELAQTSPYAGCTANAPMAFVACYRKECRMPEYAPIV